MKTDEILANKVLDIYFKENYNIGSKNNPEDLAFIRNNIFKLIVTDKTKNNGYNSDIEKVKKLLKLNTPYELKDVSVGRSSSTITLVDFPNENFNSVNFEFLALDN